VLRNGVDCGPVPPARPQCGARKARRRWQDAPVGGQSLELKGNDLVIRPWPCCPRPPLLLVGDDRNARTFESLARDVGRRAARAILGSVAQSDSRAILFRADALCWLSRREGWPNVLLKPWLRNARDRARVGGTPRSLRHPRRSAVSSRHSRALAGAARRLLDATRP